MWKGGALAQRVPWEFHAAMTKSRRNKLLFSHPSIHENNDDIITEFYPLSKNEGEVNTKLVIHPPFL